MNYNFQYLGKSELQNIPGEIEKHFLKNPYHFKAQKGTSHKISPVHMHDFTQLWYVLNGTFRHSFNDQCFNQGVGDLLIVPPYFTHRIDTSESDNVEFIFCDLSEGFLNLFPDSKEKNTLFNLTYLRPLILNAENKKPFLSFTGDSARKVENLFLELLEEYKKSNELSLTYLRAKIVRLLTLIAHEYELISPRDDNTMYIKYRTAIQNSLDYIDAHYTDNIHLNDICKISLMSVRSFSYVFKQITGKTFIEYLQYLRVRCARQLLINTNKPLLDICFESGFYDEAHFCRIFKKNIGISPNLYRKNY